MNRNVITCLLIAFLSTNAFAFDWHGVKSGMTEKEVESAMKALGAKKAGYPENKWEDFKSITLSPHTALVEYDHAGKLLELQLGYSTYKFSASSKSAMKAVLTSKYKANVVELENGMGAILVDEAALQRDIEYYKKKYNNEL